MIYTNVQVINQLDDEARGLVNRTIWEPQSLPLISLDREQWNNHQLVPWTGSEPVWVEFTINNVDKNGHPFHLVSLFFLFWDSDGFFLPCTNLYKRNQKLMVSIAWL
jgi:FtsP/CotA-like multicopper oxidase with cupredoxin domain